MGETNICLVLNNNSSNCIINSPEYKIKSYNDFDIKNLIINKTPKIKDLIIKNLNTFPIIDVVINDVDIKTGYICDIKSLSLILNNSVEDIIIKIENEENELSNVARKIIYIVMKYFSMKKYQM